MALDPATDVLGGYDPDGVEGVNFAQNSQFSWAFHDADVTHVEGHDFTPTTADEAIGVLGGSHTTIDELLTAIFNDPGGGGGVNQHFQISRLLANAPGPWVPNQFDQNGISSVNGGYEAVIATVGFGTIPQSISFVPLSAPEIAVSFSATNIVDGDASPSGTEGTDFGTVTQGTVVERVFRVDNTGTAALTASGMILPAGFTVVESLAPTITAGNFDTFTVRLDTSSTGIKNGQISFTNNDSNENPFNFEISGAVTTTPVPEIVVSFNGTNIVDGDASPSGTEGTDFGTVSQGTLVERVFRVDNTGTATLATSGMILPTGFTVVESLAPTITAGSFGTFMVRLDTSSTGTKNGQISFTNNDSNENPFNFEISGAVTTTPVPEIAVSFDGTNIADDNSSPSGSEGTDFGTVAQGTAVERMFRVDNIGTGTLTTSGFQLPPGFTVVEPLSPTITAGNFDTFTVRLDASSTGVKNGQISFVNNDDNENRSTSRSPVQSRQRRRPKSLCRSTVRTLQTATRARAAARAPTSAR